MKLKKRAVPVGKKACEACLAGKMREILSKKARKRERIPGRGLHFDTTRRILPRIKEIISRVYTFSGSKTAADNGKGEFGRRFQDELISRGIEFEPFPPYKHSNNGVVERAIHTFDCKTRSLLFEGKIPVGLWCYAVEHSV